MIIQKEYILKLDWTVYILHKVSCKDNTFIGEFLYHINCPSSIIKEVLSNLNTCSLNIGLTYSNVYNHSSVIVISKSTSSGEYVNTITHELYHLVSQLRRYKDLEEEQTAQLCGDLNMKVYRFVKNL